MSNFSQKRIALEEDIRYFSFILSQFKKKELPTSWSPKSSYTSEHLRLCSQIADILSIGMGDDGAMSVMVSEPSQTIGRGPQIRVFIVSEIFLSQSAAPPSFKNSSAEKDGGIVGATFSTTGASSRSVEVLLETAHEIVPVEQHIADVLAFIQQKATAGQVSTFVVRRCYRKIHRRLHADNLLLDNSQSPENSGLVQLLKLWAKAEKEDDIRTPYVPVAERTHRYAISELEKLAPNRDPTAETVKLEFTSRNIGDWAVALALRLQIATEAFDRLVEGTPTMENFDDAQFALASLEYFLRRHKDIWLTILRAPSFVTLALANWKFVRKDAEYANEDVPPGLSVATAMLSPPTEMSHRVLQFLFNSVTVFPSIRTLLRLIKTQHDVQVRFEVPEQPTLSKEDLKPRFLNDLAQRFAGSTPEGVIDSLSSGPLYFDGSVHPEASSMVEADSQSISDLSDFPKAVGMTRKPCFCCHYLGQAMGYDLPDTRGIVLPWSPPPSLPPQILTEMWQRLRLLYNDLLDSFTLKLQKGSKPSEFERIDGLNEGSRARYYKLLNKGLWKP